MRKSADNTASGQPAWFIPFDHEWGSVLDLEHDPQISSHTCAVQACIHAREVKVDSKFLNVCSHSYEGSPFANKAVNLLLMKKIPHARVEVRV